MIQYLLVPLVADPTGMTPTMLFTLEVLKILAPVAAAAFSALALRKSQQTHKEVGVLAKTVDGQMTRLLQQTEKAAHAEGVAEGVSAVAQAMPAPKVEVQVIPDARPGGKRRTDPPVPPDVDPGTHLR